MSGNVEEEKTEGTKIVPLDLAAKVTTVKTVDAKGPILVAGASLRGMRVFTQPPSGQSSVGASTIIATNIVPQGALKSGQITLATPIPATPPAGTTYHVPRGPAVVANLASPRSNVATAIRAPLVVAQATGQGFVRPSRTPSPAQGTTWLATNSSNGSQIKATPTVLSTPVRGTTVTGISGKPQIIARCQAVTQTVSTIRPTTTILHSAITIGQGPIHPLKQAQGTASIQAIGNVTLTQVLPTRTQTIVYSSGANANFVTTPKLTVASNLPPQRQITTTRPTGQITSTRLAMPVSVSQAATRLVAPQATVLTSGARISTVSSTQASAVIGGTTPTRIVTSNQPNVSIGRLAVTVANQSQTNNNILSQTRISLHPLVAVANNSQNRNIQTQGPKVITQPSQPGTAIHLTQIPTAIKSTTNTGRSSPRPINVPAAIVTQRQNSVVSSQAIPIAKVFPQQDGQQSVFIQARSSPNLAATQVTTTITTSSIATYSIPSGSFFYDTSGNYTVARSFNQQSATNFNTLTHSTNQIRPTSLGTQVQNIVTNQSARFNPVMVVETNRNQQYQQETHQQEQHTQHTPKMTSSPRPSILRKREHDGSPMKAAKNLMPVLSNVPTQAPVSPPSRPDSRGNGHSSGGSTTISATSSPGVAEGNDDSLPHIPMNIKEEEENRPPSDVSPRKKPRKQQLTGNDIDEHNDDMQFLSENIIKKEVDDSDGNRSEEPKDGAPESNQISRLRKPATASLLNGYRQNWKTTHNHYLRYSDVRPKDERKPTIIDLANQSGVLDKVNGWKVHHLTTQMEDLADQEQNVYDQLSDLLKCMESKHESKSSKEINQINELIKGNLQRIKIINDGMVDAKIQIMKIFDHKSHVADIISRCASKRNFKKREKS